IVWSKEKISYKYPDDSKFVSDFNADEYIFGRLYLNESVQNTVYKNTGDELDWIHI
ncbi:MAG: hypothetical protein GY756_19005, partial [bacterium]|nr:hypothetical protein [bacterium]